MPIVDGFSATKMIRSYEKTNSMGALSKRAALNGRMPIFAVSASLVEKELQRYKDTGFDGWFLKPIDFSRVNELLKGIVDATPAYTSQAIGSKEAGSLIAMKLAIDFPATLLRARRHLQTCLPSRACRGKRSTNCEAQMYEMNDSRAYFLLKVY